MKKKSVTALMLAFLMCFTTVSPALAAENVTVETEGLEKSTEEVSEEASEQEKAESAAVYDEAEDPVEEEQSIETQEKEELSEADEVSATESTQQIQVEETVDEVMNEPVAPQETELTLEASAAAAEEAATSSQEKAEKENADTVTMSGETGTVIVEGSDDAGSDEMFSEYVDIEFGISTGSAGEKNKKTTGTRLTGNDLTIYNKVAAALPAIAAGEQSSTVFEFSAEDLGVQGTWTAQELGLDSLVKDGYITDEASDALFSKIAFSAETVVRALLSDYPYELYWYDKTVGTSYKTPGLSGNSKQLSYSGNIILSFAVAKEYASGSEKYVTDTSIGQSVQTAVANADAIVSDYNGKSAIERMTGYKDKICELVDYNRSAAAGGTAYGNPWQLIWVFDGDDSTKVVCEGYSKAFKYLCDQSDIDCILVTGTMDGGTGAGAHMWDIVRMDGTNYLVDITNCDSGTIGAPDLLFLKKTDDLTIADEVEIGYTFKLTTGTIAYAYDTTTLNYYTQDELSLAGEAGEHVHTMKNVPAKAATCTEAGNYEYWSCSGCGKIFSDEEGKTETSLEEVTTAATGHTWNKEYTVDKEATSEEEGSESIHCSVCGEIKEGSERVIPIVSETKIVTQPSDVEVASGDTATFKIEVEGSVTGYQWQWSADAVTWNNCASAGYNTDTFSFKMRERFDGRSYRCVVTSEGTELISDAAYLSLKIEAEITQQPEDVTAAEGETVSFHVEAEGSVTGYRWQWSADGKTWNNCASAGYNTDTFSFKMRERFDGRSYRCVVTTEETELISDAAQLNVKSETGITQQPEDVTAAEGETVSFHVEAEGSATGYQWQWRADGKTWKNCTSAGYNTDTFSFKMKEKFDGRSYRCVVTTEGTELISDAAQLSLKSEVKITQQPEDVTAAEGETVSFHVEAEGSVTGYQWQWSADSETWKNCASAGYNTDTFSFKMRERFDGRSYRCVVTSEGKKLISDAAQLSLK